MKRFFTGPVREGCYHLHFFLTALSSCAYGSFLNVYLGDLGYGAMVIGLFSTVPSLLGLLLQPLLAAWTDRTRRKMGAMACLTAVSAGAMAAMENRKAPIASFYANILAFKDYDKNRWFPYTPPITDILGLAAAVDNVLADPDILGRHHRIAAACRRALTEGGLTLYQRSGFSDTVTVFQVPPVITAKAILDTLLE